MDAEIIKQINIAAQAIYDKKGFNILALDVRKVSTLTDYYIIAEGSVDRHVKSLCQEVVEQLKAVDVHPVHIEGLQEPSWIVMDFTDFIIHLLIPDYRERYALEELWHKAKIVDLDIKVKQV